MLTLISALLQVALLWTSAMSDDATLCTFPPAPAIALVRVEQDTLLPHGGGATGAPNSASGVRPGPYDSLLASPTTPMPAARVRLLQLDLTTRAQLAAQGITDAEPRAFIRAAPYRADCRTIVYTDTVPFAVRGEVGYIRAVLEPAEEWVDGVPVFVIRDVWNYPYPRRRSLAFRALEDEPLAPADAMFSFNTITQMPRPSSLPERVQQDSIKRERALVWARANTTAAELEPLRTLVRRTILWPDWEVVTTMPSRWRGTYHVTIDVDGRTAEWFFRTRERPGYSWLPPDSLQTIAALVHSPYIAGYTLVGHVAATRDSLPVEVLIGAPNEKRLWLGVADRPTAQGNDARLVLAGMLEFNLANVPQTLWDDLEAFVPPMNPVDSMMRSRMKITIPRIQRQPRFPLTLRLDVNGEVRADTVLNAQNRRVKVVLERLDTISVHSRF